MILSIRHAFPEKAGFSLERPAGLKSYTFLHFFGSVELLEDGKRITTKPDACIFYAPHIPQWFCSKGPLTHDWLHSEETLGKRLEQYGISENRVFYPADPVGITALFEKMESEFFSEKPFGQELLDAYLTEFLIHISRWEVGEVHSKTEKETLLALRSQVMLHLEEPWTVKKMAGLTGFSTSRFHALYKSVFGISPINDVILARTQAAQNLLLGTEQPICRIGEELGYASPYHFIRQFRQFTDMSPGAYRAAHKTGLPTSRKKQGEQNETIHHPD